MTDLAEHSFDCVCDKCIEEGLEKLRKEGKLQKLINLKSGEIVWLNADLPVPSDCAPYYET